MKTKEAKPEIGRCEMMFGWAGYNLEKIIAMAEKGKVCDCNAHGGGKCKLTGNSYFPIKK